MAQSSRFTLSLAAVGSAVSAASLTGPSHGLSGGIAGSFPPPGEVDNLRFSGPTTLQWDADAFAVDYALYKGTVGLPFDSGFGTCAQPPPAIAGLSASVVPTPAAGQASFYLVTGRNLLAQESTKGFTSAGTPRANPAPCP